MTRPPILDLDLVVVPETMTDEEIARWIDACNHGPAKDALRHYVSIRAVATAWDDVRKYVEGLEVDVKREAGLATTYAGDCMEEQKRAEAAEARIAELEKRLADAERVIEPFARLAKRFDYAGGDDTVTIGVATDELRAARAYMEGK